jgi:two-component system, chemotaxis family, chemotaxis protein CheY
MNKILIADRSPFAGTLLRDLFLQNGYSDVSVTDSGHEAIRLFRELCPDLTVMDLVFEDLDGFTVLAKMRQADPERKIIVCSTLAQKAVQVDALQSGASAFLAKPVKENELKSLI